MGRLFCLGGVENSVSDISIVDSLVFVESRILKNDQKGGPRRGSAIVPDWPNPPPILAENLSRFISQSQPHRG
jgi:hypothetical protein